MIVLGSFVRVFFLGTLLFFVTPGYGAECAEKITPISTIQGGKPVTELSGQEVIVTGVVTKKEKVGVYIQGHPACEDKDERTSNGIFLFMNPRKDEVKRRLQQLVVGQEISVRGIVKEHLQSSPYLPYWLRHNLEIERIDPLSVVISKTDLYDELTEIQVVEVLGSARSNQPDRITATRLPVSLVKKTNAYTADAYLERFEGMWVSLSNAVTVSAKRKGRDYVTVVSLSNPELAPYVEEGELARPIRENISGRYTIKVPGGNFRSLSIPAGVNLGTLTGVLSEGLFHKKNIFIDTLDVDKDRLHSRLSANKNRRLPSAGGRLSIASYNVKNLFDLTKAQSVLDAFSCDGADITLTDYRKGAEPCAELKKYVESYIGKKQNNKAPNWESRNRFDRIAANIIDGLDAPDVVALQEVHDADGPNLTTTTSASWTLGKLVEALKKRGQSYRYLTPVLSPVKANTTGGVRGSNLQSAFLIRDSFSEKVMGLTQSRLLDDGRQRCGDSIGEREITEAFNHSREPILLRFSFKDSNYYIANLHLSSNFGVANEKELEKRQRRRQSQNRVIIKELDCLTRSDSKARVIVLGDMNADGYDSNPSFSPYRNEPSHLHFTHMDSGESVPYSHSFNGAVAQLDHVIVGGTLRPQDVQFDILHINALSTEQVSDHDPVRLLVTP